jgi:hypothetical protein
MITVRQYRGLETLPTPPDKVSEEAALLLVFGTTEQLQQPEVQRALFAWSRAHVVVGASSDALISTAGLESLPVFTSLRFEQTSDASSSWATLWRKRSRRSRKPSVNRPF